MAQALRLLGSSADASDSRDDRLDVVFAALSDPVRRTILARLDGKALLVSEIAREFDISLQAVSRHIQVLVRAGLVGQERTGRISRCSLVTGPIYEAAVWLNRYSKYWQDQFDLLAVTLHELGPRRRSKAPKRAEHASTNRQKRQEK